MIRDRPCCEVRPLIRAKGLSLRYGDRFALQEISVTIDAGCVTALVGPSGCGKTSFLTSLNRLTDLFPKCRVSGSLTIGDTDILHPDLDVVALRRRIGFIFQKSNPFPLSIRRNLTFPLREHGQSKVDAEQAAESSLRDIGLWDEVKDRLDAPAQALSGGQQQRLCIARALALKPEVLLLDEPCSALDPLSAGVVEDLISSLRGRYTIVIVTHNLAQARRIADHAGLFWAQDGPGKLVEFAPAKEFFDAPKDPLTAAYVSGMRG